MVVHNADFSVIFTCNGHFSYNVTVNCTCKCMSWSMNVRGTAVAVWAVFVCLFVCLFIFAASLDLEGTSVY